MARLRKAPASQAQAQAQNQTKTQTQPAAASTRHALKEKTNTATRATASSYEDDGRAEGMIIDSKPRRGRPRKQVRQDSEDLVTAGANGPSDEPAPHSGALNTTDALVKGDAAPVPAAKGNRRPPRTVRKVAQNAAQTKVLEGLKQRMEATARGQRAKGTATSVQSDTMVVASSEALSSTLPPRKAGPRKSEDVVVERSEFSLSHSPPPPGKLSAITGKRSSITQPGSVLKAHSTPAVETSILALKNFKRRPRQPSMLAMVQQRTASARPSAVNNDLAVEDSSIYDLDLDDEDDFAPEAEGTPLNAAKKKRKSSASVRASVKRRKSAVDSTRDETQDDTFLTADEIVVAARSSSVAVETPQPVVTSDAQIAQAPSSSTPPTEPSSNNASLGSQTNEVIVPSTENEQSVREQSVVVVPSTERESSSESENHDKSVGVDESVFDAPNGTMAEPASSSPAPENPRSAQYNTDMADPVTQVSPARTRPKVKKQKPVSTAVLQALLPKRRKVLEPRRRKSEYDMESETEAEEDVLLDVSHLENDEDELGGEVQRRAPSKARGNNTTKKARATKTTARQSTAARSRKASAPSISKRGAKTYGRGANSDKENDEAFEAFEEADESILPDVSISMHDVANGKEIEEAKRKFAEVDDWDMDFESMSQEENGNSSQGWR